MIEKFERIYYFKPNIFKQIVEKKYVNDFLEDYVKFCCQQLNIKDRYKVEFTSENNGAIASFNNTKEPNSIKLNQNIFEQYKLDIEASPLSSNAMIYPFQICSAIIHEIKHAKQYEIYNDKR